MNQKEMEVLCEMTRKMVDIQIEQPDKYKAGWKDCELIEIKAKLVQKANALFLLNSSEGHLRDLVDIMNYAYFLYFRIKRGDNERISIKTEARK